MGPSFDSCSDFVALVRRQTTLSLTNNQVLDITSGSELFQGQTFNVVNQLSVIGWVFISNSNSNNDWCNLLKFYTYSNNPSDCDMGSSSQGCRVPGFFVRQSDNVFQATTEQPSVSSNAESVISCSFVRPKQSVLNTWWFFAFSYDNIARSQVDTCATTFAGTGGCQSFPYGASRLLWNTSSSNVIRFNSSISYFCSPQTKSRDVRLFVNVPLVQANLEAKYSLMLDDCVTDCEVCSDPETCQSCKAGFYLDSNYCRTCDVKCATCSAVPSCLSCAAGYFDTDSSSSTTCEMSCPAAKYGDPLIGSARAVLLIVRAVQVQVSAQLATMGTSLTLGFVSRNHCHQA
jgi:hypothetical protein